MTHYTVDYSNLTGQAKLDKAIADTVEYMGQPKFDEITEEFRKLPEMTLQRFQAFASLAGVQGFPATAWFNYCFPERKIEEGGETPT
jgi:hypothetical protein